MRLLRLYILTFLIALPAWLGSADAAVVPRITLLVSDIEKSVLFYERLGLLKISDEKRSGIATVYGAGELPLTADSSLSRLVVMKGDGQTAEIALLWYDRPPLASARGNVIGLGTGDVILSVFVPDIEAAYDALDRVGARIERPPGQLGLGGSAAQRLYAYDPDGHMVEVVQGYR